MSFVNQLPTDRAATMAAIGPLSTHAAQTSGYVDCSLFRRLLATITTGTLGTSSYVDASLVQATSSGGAGSKAVPNSAITRILKASGDNKVAQINFDTANIDVANGYRYVALVITPSGSTSPPNSSIVGGTLQGFDPFNGPASASDPAADVQIVSV